MNSHSEEWNILFIRNKVIVNKLSQLCLFLRGYVDGIESCGYVLKQIQV